jgi:hypothetical protein
MRPENLIKNEDAVSISLGFILMFSISVLVFCGVVLSFYTLSQNSEKAAMQSSFDILGSGLAVRMTTMDTLVNISKSYGGTVNSLEYDFSIPATIASEGYSINTNSTSYTVVNNGAPANTIMIDNTGKVTDCSGVGGSSCTSTALSITNFTVGSGTNRLLVVGVNYYLNPGTTNVKYNGVNLTRAKVANTGSFYAELWYMINPPSGTYTINQTQTTGTQVVMGAWSYTGVDQVTGIGNITNATGGASNASVNITTTANNSVLVDVETDDAKNLTVGPGQTLRYWVNYLKFVNGGGSDMNATTIQTYKMNWTLNQTVTTWVNIAAEIKPVNSNVTITNEQVIMQSDNGAKAWIPFSTSSNITQTTIYSGAQDYKFIYNGTSITIGRK